MFVYFLYGVILCAVSPRPEPLPLALIRVHYGYWSCTDLATCYFVNPPQSKQRSSHATHRQNHFNHRWCIRYWAGSGQAVFTASKVAVRFYTEALRRHLHIIQSPIKIFELLPPLVATDMAAGFESGAISPEKLVHGLIAGLKNDTTTIRVGMTKIMHLR